MGLGVVAGRLRLAVVLVLVQGLVKGIGAVAAAPLQMKLLQRMLLLLLLSAAGLPEPRGLLP